MRWLSARNEGSAASPAVPFEFALFQYRREMGLTYAEAAATPYDVFRRDLAYMELEAKMRPEPNP